MEIEENVGPAVNEFHSYVSLPPFLTSANINIKLQLSPMLHEIGLKRINNYFWRSYKDLRLYCKYFVNQSHNELTSSTRSQSVFLMSIIAQGRGYSMLITIIISSQAEWTSSILVTTLRKGISTIDRVNKESAIRFIVFITIEYAFVYILREFLWLFKKI